MDSNTFMDMNYVRGFLEDIACGAASDWPQVTLFRHDQLMTDPDLRIPWATLDKDLEEICDRLRIVLE